jgi:broad specificity phosphatase PhoE
VTDRAATDRRATRTVVHLLRHGEVHNPDGVLYGQLPGFRLSDRGRDQAKVVAEALAGADLADRLIEAGNSFEGRTVGAGAGVLRDPRHWWRLRDPFTPSWGEPYRVIAHRMLAAAHRARELASGREALCVSHQLPIWTLRRYVTGRHLWHDPRRRQCALASLTSLVFDDAELVQLRYTEPAGHSDPTQTGA